LKRWKILIFSRGIPSFSNESENEASGTFGAFLKIFFFMYMAYSQINENWGKTI